VQTGDVTSVGIVREFHPDEGWGVVDGADVPGGCWVHFSAIAVDGFRQLAAGQQVWFRAEAADQNGYRFRAVKVWAGDVEPVDAPGGQPSSGGAYRAGLTLVADEPPGPDQP
jgi:CspA family cold shock protein